MMMRKILLFIVVGVLSLNLASAQEKGDSTELRLERRDSTDVGAPEVMPKFEGGSVNYFSQWVSKHVEYPKDALNDYIDGKVVLKFLVGKDGRLSEVDIIESPSDVLSRAVLKAVISAPRWTPGVAKGENVRFWIQIPIVFKMDKHNLRKQAREQSRSKR